MLLLRLSIGNMLVIDMQDKAGITCILIGFPPHSSYLFLGDYIDRGKMGVECTMLLFCYKLKYPNLVHLLRGNHECTSISRIYGFHDECVQRFNADIWKQVSI